MGAEQVAKVQSDDFKFAGSRRQHAGINRKSATTYYYPSEYKYITVESTMSLLCLIWQSLLWPARSNLDTVTQTNNLRWFDTVHYVWCKGHRGPDLFRNDAVRTRFTWDVQEFRTRMIVVSNVHPARSTHQAEEIRCSLGAAHPRKVTRPGRILRFSTWAAVFLVDCGHEETKIGWLNRWWRERIGKL